MTKPWENMMFSNAQIAVSDGFQVAAAFGLSTFIPYNLGVMSLDACQTVALRARLDEIAGKSGDLTLDFGSIDFMDSAGLGFLKSLRLLLEARGNVLRLQHVRGQPNQLLAMVRWIS
jgi:anti-anti-sigma regulatory factor